MTRADVIEAIARALYELECRRWLPFIARAAGVSIDAPENLLPIEVCALQAWDDTNCEAERGYYRQDAEVALRVIEAERIWESA